MGRTTIGINKGKFPVLARLPLIKTIISLALSPYVTRWEDSPNTLLYCDNPRYSQSITIPINITLKYDN